MRFTSQTSTDGVTEQSFTLGEIPGVLWTPEDAEPCALILIGHGGGQHEQAPGVVARAHRLAAECGRRGRQGSASGDRPCASRSTRWRWSSSKKGIICLAQRYLYEAYSGESLGVSEIFERLTGAPVPDWMKEWPR
jgi:hypothetical protein